MDGGATKCPNVLSSDDFNIHNTDTSFSVTLTRQLVDRENYNTRTIPFLQYCLPDNNSTKLSAESLANMTQMIDVQLSSGVRSVFTAFSGIAGSKDFFFVVSILAVVLGYVFLTLLACVLEPFIVCLLVIVVCAVISSGVFMIYGGFHSDYNVFKQLYPQDE